VKTKSTSIFKSISFKNENTNYGSSNHSEFGASELALEEPVAQIYSEINLVVFCYVKYRFLIFHVHRHKLIANFRSVFSIIY